MPEGRLSEREKTIVALLKTYGPSPTNKIMRVVFPGQTVFLPRQTQYLLRTMNRLKTRGFVEKDSTGMLWKATEKDIF